MTVPVGIGACVIFLYRRIDQGVWDFSEPMAVLLIAALLVAPGASLLVSSVQTATLFLVGLVALSASMLVGLAAAAAGGGDGQAGLGILLTPVFGVAAVFVLGRYQGRRQT